MGDTDEESFALTLRAKYNWLRFASFFFLSLNLPCPFSHSSHPNHFSILVHWLSACNLEPVFQCPSILQTVPATKPAAIANVSPCAGKPALCLLDSICPLLSLYCKLCRVTTSWMSLVQPEPLRLPTPYHWEGPHNLCSNMSPPNL